MLLLKTFRSFPVLPNVLVVLVGFYLFLKELSWGLVLWIYRIERIKSLVGLMGMAQSSFVLLLILMGTI